jgi:hypothetical protein
MEGYGLAVSYEGDESLKTLVDGTDPEVELPPPHAARARAATSAAGTIEPRCIAPNRSE